MSRMIDCTECEGSGDVDGNVCSGCEGTGKVGAPPPPCDAVWIDGVWKAIVHGEMQKPHFQDRGGALTFAQKAANGRRWLVITPSGLPVAELWAPNKKKALADAKEQFGSTAGVREPH